MFSGIFDIHDIFDLTWVSLVWVHVHQLSTLLWAIFEVHQPSCKWVGIQEVFPEASGFLGAASSNSTPYFPETFKKPFKKWTPKIKEETFHAFFSILKWWRPSKKQRQPAVEGNHQKSRRFCPASEALISRVSSCWCWVLEVWHEGIQKHRRWAVWPRCPADDGGKLKSLWEVDQLSRWRCLLGSSCPQIGEFSRQQESHFFWCLCPGAYDRQPFFRAMVGWWKMVKWLKNS